VALNTRTEGRRLPPEIFDLPVEKMREGYYTDAYFNHTRSALLADGRHPRVVMQVFQRKEAILGGMDEALAILELCSHGWEDLTVHALETEASLNQARRDRCKPPPASGPGALPHWPQQLCTTVLEEIQRDQRDGRPRPQALTRAATTTSG